MLHGIDLAVREGEFACLIGPSGSGKSTLLNLIGLLEWPSAGSYHLKGRPIAQANDDERTRARLRRWVSCSSSTICCRRFPRSRT